MKGFESLNTSNEHGRREARIDFIPGHFVDAVFSMVTFSGRPLAVPLGSRCISLGRQQKIDGLAFLVHRAIELFQTPFNFT